jgi:hypothetical protein
MVVQQTPSGSEPFWANERRNHYEGKGATTMTESPTHAQPGFVAEEPEHCHDGYRLITPGETYFLTMELAVLCPDRVTMTDSIRLAGGLTVEVGEDRLPVRRGGTVVEVLPHDVRRLVDALVEAATLLYTGRWVRRAWTSGPPISAGWRMSWK